MTRGTGWICASVAVLVGGCAAAHDDGATSTTDALNARSDALWPVANGVVEVRVCWLAPAIAPDRFPVPELAPDVAEILPERKAWVQQIVVSQWNARTPVHFVGWGNCDASSAADGFVGVEPIDSSRPACPGTSAGQSCADALGKFAAGKVVHINMFFGDEFLYDTFYRAAAGDQADPSKGLSYWIPAACLDDFREPWWSGASNLAHQRDITDPAVYEDALRIYTRCLQTNTAHEFGHVAGFAHEQYRGDDPAAQAACVAYEKQNGLADDLANLDPAFKGDTALGVFDFESIMSYCRRDVGPRLTHEDVAMTRRIYR